MRYLLVFVLVFASGCGVVLHPVTGNDIWSVEKGAVVLTQEEAALLRKAKVPGVTGRVIKKPGWILSDYYVKEVMRATVKVSK